MTKTIEDILKEMPLDQEVKNSLKESWKKELADAKTAQIATIREEQAEQYTKDLDNIQESVGIFLDQRLKPHIEDLHEGIKTVERLKIEYAEKSTMIKEQAQTYVRKRLAAIEIIVEKHMKKELGELHEDVVANRRAVLQSITENNAKAEADSERFKIKAAGVLENIINVKLPKQLDELREDIEASRKDNFGREIFEAYSVMFRRQFFDTSSEFKKLAAENDTLKEDVKKVTNRAAKAVRESREESRNSKRAYNKLNEGVVRRQTINRLLKPLAGNTRAQMKSLLEATKTAKLDQTFRKSYPAMVTEAKTPTKKIIRERKSSVVKQPMTFMAGGTQQLDESTYDEFDNEVADIRRLAGNQ